MSAPGRHDAETVGAPDPLAVDDLRAAPPLSPAALDEDLFRRKAMRRARRRDLARLLPALGALLLATPVLDVFGAPVTLFGAPLIIVYLFGVWAFLILAAALLAERDIRPAGGYARPPEQDGADRAP